MEIALVLLRKFWWAIPILLLTASTAFYRHQAHQERASRIQIQAEYDTFKASIVAAAKLKESEYAKRLSDARLGRSDALKRLREQTSGGSVPTFTAPAGDSRICWEPETFNAAIQRLAEIIASGDSAQIDAQTLLGGWPK